MRNEFKQELLKWIKDENITGSREITFIKNEILIGEYIVKIQLAIKVNNGSEEREVKVSRKFQTFAQANEDLNVQGDIYHFKQISDILLSEFVKEYDSAIEELYEDDSFFSQLERF